MEQGNLMDRQPVNSSDICSVGYDAESRILEIEFHSGGIYHYAKVPEKLYRGLMQASSKGSYFHRNIRERYPTTRIR